MFKVLKNELYDGFACVTRDCPANCCDEDWVIRIDGEAYQKLCALGLEDMDAKITPEEPHTIIKKDHKCPFITEEGLCTIHAYYGEDHLSNTCRSYPRFVTEYQNVYTMTLGLSCPEVARLVLALDRPIGFVEEYYYEQKSEIGRRDIRVPSEDILERISVYLDGPCHMIDACRQLESVLGRAIEITEIPLYELMRAMRRWAETVREGSLLEALDGAAGLLSFEKLAEMIRSLEQEYPFLLINMFRSYLFERILYREKDSNIKYSHVLARAEIQMILFCCVLIVNGYGPGSGPEALIRSLYRTMRVIDHGENVIDEMLREIGLTWAEEG